MLQLTQPDDPQDLIKTIENSAIEEEYKETMQTVAQYLQQEGRQEGILLGEYQRNRDNARKMLKKGIDRTIVKEITGLPDVELDTL